MSETQRVEVRARDVRPGDYFGGSMIASMEIDAVSGIVRFTCWPNGGPEYSVQRDEGEAMTVRRRVPRMAVVQDTDTGEALTEPMEWDQADRIARAPSVVGRNVAAVYVS
jgi:hypothetical protein